MTLPGRRPDLLGDWFLNTLTMARRAELSDRETVENLLSDLHQFIEDQAQAWAPSDERDDDE
jgi:nucleoid-associated protein YejK